jgi:hypothetical protein
MTDRMLARIGAACRILYVALSIRGNEVLGGNALLFVGTMPAVLFTSDGLRDFGPGVLWLSGLPGGTRDPRCFKIIE